MSDVLRLGDYLWIDGQITASIPEKVADTECPATMKLVLEFAKVYGLGLEHDGSKSHGVHITDCTGAHRGHVQIFANVSWRSDLCEKLAVIAAQRKSLQLPKPDDDEVSDEVVNRMMHTGKINIWTLQMVRYGFWFLLATIFAWLWGSVILAWVGAIGCGLWFAACLFRWLYYNMPHKARLIGSALGFAIALFWLIS